MASTLLTNPANKYLFKSIIGTLEKSEICSMLTIKTPERPH